MNYVQLYSKQVKCLSFGKDIATVGSSKCRFCEEKIEKGGCRIYIDAYHNYSLFPSGGGTKNTKLFFHKNCFLRNIDFKSELKRRCKRCNEITFTSSEHRVNEYCLACVCHPRLGKCSGCGQFYDSSDLSEVLANEILFENKSDLLECHNISCTLCLECESNFNAETKRSKDRTTKKLSKIKREMVSWTNANS